jgi:TPR repeat protein
MTEQEVRNAILQAQNKAEQGDVISQHFLGISYLGLKDYVMAAKWFEKAAEQGYADAQLRLGLQYSAGQGVSEDKVKGLELIGKAAEQGYARAQFHMGLFAEDNAKSAEWYEKAAEQGDADAQYELGLLYFTGEGVPKDRNKAGQWFKKAGDQGNEKAKEYLGKVVADALFDNPEIQDIRNAAAHKAYMEGNHTKAAELYGEMADRGNAMAQYKLGLLYALGQGVQYNSKKSDELIRKAAAQGLKEAKDWLEKEEREKREREEREKREKHEREERERKEREHQEWLASEEGQKWQAEEKRKQEDRKRKESAKKRVKTIIILLIIAAIVGFIVNSAISSANTVYQFPRTGNWSVTYQDSRKWTAQMVINKIDNDSFSGYFLWRGGKTLWGYEYFDGVYDSQTGKVSIEGNRIGNHNGDIGLGKYQASVTGDRKNFESGTGDNRARWDAKWKNDKTN